MGFFLWFWGPVIDTWTLRGNNALELANQSSRYIGYKHKTCNNVPYSTSICHYIIILPDHCSPTVIQLVISTLCPPYKIIALSHDTVCKCTQLTIAFQANSNLISRIFLNTDRTRIEYAVIVGIRITGVSLEILIDIFLSRVRNIRAIVLRENIRENKHSQIVGK